MNIVLIGYRGTGKSVVGRILAKRLGMAYQGMDANIVVRAEMSIPEIVDRYGWSRFREIETEEALDLSERDNLIIDTGGGVIERAENMLALAKNGIVFWLKASVETIVRRIQGGDQRPALTEGKTFTEEVEGVLDRRRDKYASAAQHEIDTDDVTPDQVAEKIISLLK